jgi:hypothetical protein
LHGEVLSERVVLVEEGGLDKSDVVGRNADNTRTYISLAILPDLSVYARLLPPMCSPAITSFYDAQTYICFVQEALLSVVECTMAKCYIMSMRSRNHQGSSDNGRDLLNVSGRHREKRRNNSQYVIRFIDRIVEPTCWLTELVMHKFM